MRLIVQQYYGFGQKKTFKIEIEEVDTTDNLISVVATKIGRKPHELVIKCKREQFAIKIVEGWPIDFYELSENQNIFVEIRENELDTKQKESQRQTEKYLQKLFQNQREKPQKLSAVSETSENSDDEENSSKQKSQASNTNIDVGQSDLEDRIFSTVRSGNLEQLEQLSQKINVQLLNQAQFGGWNPIHFATFLEYGPIVRFLISKEVDINKVTDEGWTPLQIAIHRHNIDLTKILINHPSIEVNQITDKGLALNLACKSNQMSIIELLIQKNADPNLQDKTERCAYDYCNQETKNKIEQMKKNAQIREQIKNAEGFIPPRPPIVRGFIHKTGQMVVTLNERYFVLNPDEGTFIRFKNFSDYPLRPLEIITLKSVKSVSMTSKGFIFKSGYHYFELLYSTRILLACRHEATAKKWVEYIYKATVYYQYIEEKIKEGKLDPNLIEKNLEFEIEDSNNPKSLQSDPPPKQFSPEQSIILPRDEATLIIEKRLSNPEQIHRFSQSPPRNPEIPKEKQTYSSQNSSMSQNSVSTLDTSMELLKDKVTFDQFEIIKELGSGAFGKVFLVKYKNDGKVYAMKALKKKTLILKKQIKYAITEANVLKMCKHPFILGLHYAFQTPNFLYLVLDYCQGGDLSYHIANQERFSEEATRFYIAEIVLAIEFLHSKDVIYRDMKPENILLDQQGHVKLADFGLSKEGVRDADKATSFCGSPAYLSPDVLGQKGASKASDIYGIGCVMYEMLEGESPYYDDDIQKMYKNILGGTLKWKRKISIEAKNLITKMLERDPTKRIGSKSKEEIKQDPFFKNIDWNKVYYREYKPPITDFSDMQDDDQGDFDINDEIGYNGKVFQDFDYDQENNRTNRVKNFSFATNTS